MEKNKNDKKTWRKYIIRKTRKRIVLKRILKKENGQRDWTRLAQEEEDSVVGACGHSNDPLGSIKFWEFLVWLSNCWLLVKGSVPWS
jgi:hypothetical protein